MASSDSYDIPHLTVGAFPARTLTELEALVVGSPDPPSSLLLLFQEPLDSPDRLDGTWFDRLYRTLYKTVGRLLWDDNWSTLVVPYCTNFPDGYPELFALISAECAFYRDLAASQQLQTYLVHTPFHPSSPPIKAVVRLVRGIVGVHHDRKSLTDLYGLI